MISETTTIVRLIRVRATFGTCVSRAGQFGSAVARAQEAVVANTVEASGKHVEEKAANEFPRGQRQRLRGVLGIGAIVTTSS